MVGELNRAGLLERAEDDADRRRTIVRISERYREDVDAWLQLRVDPVRRTLLGLTPRERTVFVEGWRLLEQETAAGETVATKQGCDR
jgi:DNA-binding MarR family transcriptional regulator